MGNYPAWQPITNAQKPNHEGLPILAVDGAGMVRVVCWDHTEKTFFLVGKRWLFLRHIDFDPTHWMALPPLPVLEGVQ